MEHRNNVNASLLTQLEKFNNKMNEKKVRSIRVWTLNM